MNHGSEGDVPGPDVPGPDLLGPDVLGPDVLGPDVLGPDVLGPDAVSRGVLLVGHGTRDPVGTDQFFALGRQLANRIGPLPVASALLEFQQPTIPDAWATLVESGVQHVHVAPLLLFAAGHAKQDIPEILSACQSNWPGVSLDQSRPLSRHRSIIDLTLQRLNETLASITGPASRVAVVMVGRGSHDPCAKADMRLLSEIVDRRIDADSTLTAFYAMAEPRLSDVLSEIALSGRFDHVVVHPHLLFEGRLFQAIVAQTEKVARVHSNMDWVTSRYLGPDERVADAIAARIAQAATVGRRK